MRILAASLAISVPAIGALAYVMFTQATNTGVAAAKLQAQDEAMAAANRMTLWVDSAQNLLDHVAAESGGPAGHLNSGLSLPLGSSSPFESMAIFEPNGTMVASTGADPDLATVPTAPWFLRAMSADTMQPVAIGKDGFVWFISAPIRGQAGDAQGTVVGNLDVRYLGEALGASGKGMEAHIATSDHLLLYTTDWGVVVDDSEAIVRGALSTRLDPATVDAAIASDAGASQMTDYRGRQVIAGHQALPALHWVVFADIDVAVALAGVYSAERLMALITIIAAAFTLGFAIFVASIVVRPIVRMRGAAARVARGDLTVRFRPTGGSELRELGAAFNLMIERLGGLLGRLGGEVNDSAAKLATAAEQLASATYEQTAAAAATSASMESLGRSSVSIADTIDKVALQAGEVRANLELARTDLRASGDRTLALAGRVNEIEGILALINDIADQTSLLALNAAIEAARAGEAGRGFAVVADEVRRLADRSKTASAQIAKLVESAQAQSTETVMALEKGVKQMERGLTMMLAMAEISGQVQQATQQQRASTDDVVRAIEHIAESSRAVAATAQEIAAAAARQGALAADLAAEDWEAATTGARDAG